MATAFHQVKNDVRTTLASGHTSGSGTLVVASAATLPTVPFYVTVVTAASVNTTAEVKTRFRCTARTGTTLTVSVVADSTDRAFASGDTVEGRNASQLIEELQTAVNTAETTLAAHTVSTANPHSVTAAQVGAYTIADANAAFSAIGHNHAGVYQPIDGDLTAVAGLTTTGFIERTGSGTATARTLLSGDIPDLSATYATAGHNHSGTYQPADATLTALAALDGTAGLLEVTGADTFTRRALGVAASTSVPTRADADTRYAAASHAHAASDLTSGTVATARLGSGTASASTYLRGDQTWATVTASVAIGSAITSGTAGRVLFVDASGNLGQDAGLNYDATTDVLTASGNRTNLGGSAAAASLHFGSVGALVKPSSGDRGLLEIHSPNGTERCVIQAVTGYGVFIQGLSSNPTVFDTATYGSHLQICGGQYEGFRFVATYGGTPDVGLGRSAAGTLTVTGGASGVGNLGLGALLLNGLADSSAPNGSLYYSTTQTKVCYKDSGGTVIPLH